MEAQPGEILMKRIITTALLSALISAVPAQAGIKAVMRSSLDKAQALASKGFAQAKQHPYIAAGTAALVATFVAARTSIKNHYKATQILPEQIKALRNISIDASQTQAQVRYEKLNEKIVGKNVINAIKTYNQDPKLAQNRTVLYSTISPVIQRLEKEQQSAARWGFVGKLTNALHEKWLNFWVGDINY